MTVDMVQSAPLALATLWYVVYQRIQSESAARWYHCANQLNKIRESSSQAARFGLAADLVKLDLWAKRAFAKEFSSSLRLAIDLEYGVEQGGSVKARLHNRTLSEAEALCILETQELKTRKKTNQ